MGPGAPSSGPGLKPKECSLVWTSLISSRRSASGAGSGIGAAGANSTDAFSLTGVGATCVDTGKAAGGAGGEGILAAGGDGAGAGAGGTAATSMRDTRSVFAVARGDGGSGVTAMTTMKQAMPMAATAAPAVPRAVFNRRARAKSYASSAARRASAAACGSFADCRAARSPSRLVRPARDCLKCSSTGPLNSLKS